MYSNITPEAALLRAEEFEVIGRKELALEKLQSVLKSRKERMWVGTYETIVQKFIRLCVDLRNVNLAKEGLYQYKRLCQREKEKSFNNALTSFLQLAEERCKNSSKETLGPVLDPMYEDATDAPLDDNKNLQSPWIRYVWECYKQCLDLIRRDSLRQMLYKDLALKAMQFCVKYNRKMDLKRLGDILTHHWTENKTKEDYGNPEGRNLALQIRMALLDSAIGMEYWQATANFAEYIKPFFDLLRSKPALSASYLEKAILIFRKTGNALFHACALQKYYLLYRERKKNVSSSELQNLASRVLCATLAVPLFPFVCHSNFPTISTDSEKENQLKMASLLSCRTIPTRSSLVNDLMRHDIVTNVRPELKKMYDLLELEFQPTDLPTSIQRQLEHVTSRDDLNQYAPQIRDVTITKFIVQMSQVFGTIGISHMNSMVPFVDSMALQKHVIDVATNLNIDVKIDHRTDSFVFDSMVCFDGTKFGKELSTMSEKLETILAIIQRETIEKGKKVAKLETCKSFKESSKNDRKKMLSRKQIIENVLARMEGATLQAKNQKAQEEMEKKRKEEAELARRAKESEEKARQKKINEHKEIEKKMLKEKVAQIKKMGAGAKAFADISEETLETMNIDEVIAKQVEQLEKERKEKEEQAKAKERQMDFYERAKRLEEIPLLLKKIEIDQAADKTYWEEAENERVRESIKERKTLVEGQKRLMRMSEEVKEFTRNAHDQRSSAFNKMLEEEKAKLLLERKEKRKEERREAWIKEREEEKRREMERQARAKKEQEEREEQEKTRRLNAQAEMQRQRDMEIEEKRKKDSEKQAPTQKYVAPRGNSRWSKLEDSEKDARPADNRWSQRKDDKWERARRDEPPKDREGWNSHRENYSRPSNAQPRREDAKRSDDSNSWRKAR